MNMTFTCAFKARFRPFATFQTDYFTIAQLVCRVCIADVTLVFDFGARFVRSFIVDLNIWYSIRN